MKTNASSTQAAARQHAAPLAALIRRRDAEYRALDHNPMIAQSQIGAVQQQHRAETLQLAAPMLARLRAVPAAHRTDNVLTVAPDYSASTPTRAMNVAAVAANATALSPRVFARVLSDATARGDLALLSTLLPVAESLNEYSRPFLASADMTAAVVGAQQALENTPELIASREAASYCDDLEREIRTLEGVLSADAPIDLLDSYIQFGALANTLPSEAV